MQIRHERTKTRDAGLVLATVFVSGIVLPSGIAALFVLFGKSMGWEFVAGAFLAVLFLAVTTLIAVLFRDSSVVFGAVVASYVWKIGIGVVVLAVVPSLTDRTFMVGLGVLVGAVAYPLLGVRIMQRVSVSPQ